MVSPRLPSSPRQNQHQNQPLLSRSSSSSSPDEILTLTTFRPPEEHTQSPTYLSRLLRYLLSPWKTLFDALRCCACYCCCYCGNRSQNHHGPAGEASSRPNSHANDNDGNDNSNTSLCFSLPALTQFLSTCPPLGFNSAVSSRARPRPVSRPVSRYSTRSEGYYRETAFFGRRPRRYAYSQSSRAGTPPTPIQAFWESDMGSPPSYQEHSSLRGHQQHGYFIHNMQGSQSQLDYYFYNNQDLHYQDPEPLTPGLQSRFLTEIYSGTEGANTRANPSATSDVESLTGGIGGGAGEAIVAYGHGYDVSRQRMVYRRIEDSGSGDSRGVMRRGRRMGRRGSSSGVATNTGNGISRSPRLRRNDNDNFNNDSETNTGNNSTRQQVLNPKLNSTTTRSSSISTQNIQRNGSSWRGRMLRTRTNSEGDFVYEADYDGEDLTASSTAQSSDEDSGDIDDFRPGMVRVVGSSVSGGGRSVGVRRRRSWVWGGEGQEGEDEGGRMSDEDGEMERRPLLVSGMSRQASGHGRQRSYGSSDATPRPGGFLMEMLASSVTVAGAVDGSGTGSVSTSMEGNGGEGVVRSDLVEVGTLDQAY